MFYCNCLYSTLWISSIILMTIIFVIQLELTIKMDLLSIQVQVKKKDSFIMLIVLDMSQQQVNLIIQMCLIVSIRPTTGIKPLYTTIATVTMNLIVSAAIVLLNPYVTVYISYKIPPFALSVHIPDVSTSIYVEVDSKVLLGLPFCDKAFVR